ncbi:hypothetical protein [Actinophytocola sp.]|uniref:hypothetical protein n=1 Tax=Actinophytocola sp. TaxID=1872138 RepID=UPI00389A0454
MTTSALSPDPETVSAERAPQAPDDPRQMPLLRLVHSPEPEEPAYVPGALQRDGDHNRVRALIHESHPSIEYATQRYRQAEVVVHVFRDAADGTYAVLYHRTSGRNTVKQSRGMRPLWQELLALLCYWDASGRG